MPRIVLVGAGSVEFTRNLLGDILTSPALRDSEIVLHDIDPDRLAIRSVAAMLGADERSATAIVVAKRLLRRNPDRWKTATAKRRTSVLAVILALLFGSAVGLLASGLLS